MLIHVMMDENNFYIDFLFESSGKSIALCLGVDLLDMPRTPYWASEGKRSQ